MSVCQLVKMLITLEPHGNFAQVYRTALSYNWHTQQSFVMDEALLNTSLAGRDQ